MPICQLTCATIVPIHHSHAHAGSGDSDLLVLDAKTGDLCATLTGHTSVVTQVASNPMYQVIASGCVNVALWLPTNV
ncbi:hypothetical protein EON63_11495 [archaeon]|nr:MAG: hypothetical protein EON63_11495 [archaeon]